MQVRLNTLRSIAETLIWLLVYLLSTVMLGVFIYELVLNAKNQGTPISFHVSMSMFMRGLYAYDWIACSKPHAGAISERPHQRWGTLSAMHDYR